MGPSPWTGADMSAWKGGGPESDDLSDFQTLASKDDRRQDDMFSCVFFESVQRTCWGGQINGTYWHLCRP